MYICTQITTKEIQIMKTIIEILVFFAVVGSILIAIHLAGGKI